MPESGIGRWKRKGTEARPALSAVEGRHEGTKGKEQGSGFRVRGSGEERPKGLRDEHCKLQIANCKSQIGTTQSSVLSPQSSIQHSALGTQHSLLPSGWAFGSSRDSGRSMRMRSLPRERVADRLLPSSNSIARRVFPFP